MGDVTNKKFPVHNEGHVILIDHMGSDSAIVEAARTSYQKGTKHVSTNRGLIRRLLRHRHTSPFESCVLKFHIKLPIFVERQWARHRTAGWNEVSARYSELPEEVYIPEEDYVRLQSKTNKQGSGGLVPPNVAYEFIKGSHRLSESLFAIYRSDLNDGIARETARINLPLSTYTEKVWWINLHNLLHFLQLRMDKNAQREIRDFATVIGNEIVSQVFPVVWEAFQDYRINSMTLSRFEVEALRELLKGRGITSEDVEKCAKLSSLSAGEHMEAEEKIMSLVG